MNNFATNNGDLINDTQDKDNFETEKWGTGDKEDLFFYSLSSCYSVSEYIYRQLGFPVWKTLENDFSSASFPLQETHEIVAIKKFKDSEGIYIFFSFCI